MNEEQALDAYFDPTKNMFHVWDDHEIILTPFFSEDSFYYRWYERTKEMEAIAIEASDVPHFLSLCECEGLHCDLSTAEYYIQDKSKSIAARMNDLYQYVHTSKAEKTTKTNYVLAQILDITNDSLTPSAFIKILPKGDDATRDLVKYLTKDDDWEATVRAWVEDEREE